MASRNMFTLIESEVFADCGRDFIFSHRSPKQLESIVLLPNAMFGYESEGLHLRVEEEEEDEDEKISSQRFIHADDKGFNKIPYMKMKNDMLSSYLTARQEAMNSPDKPTIKEATVAPFWRLLDLLMERKVAALERLEFVIPVTDPKDCIEMLDIQMKRDIETVSSLLILNYL